MTITCDSCRSEPDNRHNSQGFADRELKLCHASHVRDICVQWQCDTEKQRSTEQRAGRAGRGPWGSVQHGPTWSNDCNDFLGRGKACDRFWHHLGQHLLVIGSIGSISLRDLLCRFRFDGLQGTKPLRPPNATCVNMSTQSTQDAQGIDLMQNDAEWCRMMQLHSMQKRTAIEQQHNIFFRIEQNQHIVTAFQCWEQHQWGMREVVPGIQRIWVQIALRVSNQKATRWSNRNRQKRELHS